MGIEGRPRWEAQPAELEALVSSLISLMRGGGIGELDLTFDAVSIRLRAHPAPPPEGVVALPVPVEAPAAEPAPAEHIITAPMIGTYYAAPSPGAPPYVEVGDLVELGQVVGIIEAMKIMNEIIADQAGIVGALLAGNAQPVEYGSPLILLTLPSPSGDGAA